MTPLERIRFDDDFVRSLPGDPSESPYSRQVHGAAWSPVRPTPVRAPTLLAWSDEAAALIGAERPGPAAVEILGGNRLAPGMRPYAACYGGHQFGSWAGQLGDGRAIVLGETRGIEVQLKGAGPTPYSRRADGRAVLRSSVREFICSEAMHHLAVPTTRALALIGTGESVVRDMFYDGNAEPEPGAIVTRLAPSFVRFGSFELFASRGEHDLLGALASWVVTRHFPELGAPSPAVFADWYEVVARRTASLVARWMGLGFVHGVMNTDNLSILGVTIDYGPYGWLDVYDPDFTPNTTDAGQGRYRWAHQPAVAHWNLAMLARALVPLVGDPAPLQAVYDAWPALYAAEWRARLSEKLGLDLGSGDELVNELFEILGGVETDWTIFFRKLADVPSQGAGALDPAFYAEPGAEHRRRLGAWLAALAIRSARSDPDARREAMNRANPWIVPRNWVVQEAIEAGDAASIGRLLDAVRDPWTEKPENARLAGRRPEWARDKAGCSALSCSS